MALNQLGLTVCREMCGTLAARGSAAAKQAPEGMMAAKLRSIQSSPAPSLSPERKILAATINHRNDVRTRIGHLEAAASEMQRDHWGLQRDLDAARAHIAEADQLAVDNEVNRRMNRPLVSGMSPNESRGGRIGAPRVSRLEDRTKDRVGIAGGMQRCWC